MYIYVWTLHTTNTKLLQILFLPFQMCKSPLAIAIKKRIITTCYIMPKIRHKTYRYTSTQTYIISHDLPFSNFVYSMYPYYKYTTSDHILKVLIAWSAIKVQCIHYDYVLSIGTSDLPTKKYFLFILCAQKCKIQLALCKIKCLQEKIQQFDNIRSTQKHKTTFTKVDCMNA